MLRINPIKTIAFATALSAVTVSSAQKRLQSSDREYAKKEFKATDIDSINFDKLKLDNSKFPYKDEFISRYNSDNSQNPTNPAISGTEYFANKTLKLNNKHIEHRTVLLDKLAADVGLYEITPSQYSYLLKNNPNELYNTQYKIIKGHGKINHPWCAHAVSYYSKLAGVNIGAHKAGVQQFIDWAGKDYVSLPTKPMTAENYERERKSRMDKIKNYHLPKMKEGDFIIWKTNDLNKKPGERGSFIVKLSDGQLKVFERSHIGVIEAVDLEKGVVTVIEGNSNEPVTADDAERIIVSTLDEGVNGDQEIGEFQEVNKRDGLIRKEYTIEELACFGYTGFVDNSSRVPLK